MPLFSYGCVSCEYVVEKFQHNAVDKPQLVCPDCDGYEFERLFSSHHNRTILNAKETYSQQIKPDIDRISRNISKGKDKDFTDVYGEK